MLLINPRSTRFGIFDKYVPLSVPIGIGYLAASLLSKGKKVKIINEHIDIISEDMLKESLNGLSEPHIFGISTLTPCVARSYEIARLTKSLYPESKVILGGIHPTVLPEEVLENRDVDFVVRGEGEDTLVELYDAIKDGKDYTDIKGISFRKSDGIIHNPDAHLPDLNKSAAFPYYLFEGHLDRYSLGFITSSRGCPYACIFCSQRAISGQKLRYVPVDVVIGELELLIEKYKQSHINFADDNFTMMIRKEFYRKATFDCQTRADAVDEEILDLLKRAGFRFIDFGIETASERLMVLLEKKETVQDNIKAVKMSKRHGLGVSATFIFGLPTETRKDRMDAYRLAKKLGLDYARFNNATPYPGTLLYEIAKREGRLFIKRDWSNLNACASLVQDSLTETRLPYVPSNCDEKILRQDIVKANLFFSLRPSRVFRLLIKRIGPAGWFYLPPRWYVKPRNWFDLAYLGYKLFKTLVLASI
jgi:radical SAM superfamily enzyme YgiQ (UPF0313 family)